MRGKLESRYLDCYKVVAILLLVGCGSEKSAPERVTRSVLGEPRGKASDSIARTQAGMADGKWQMAEGAWQRARFSFVQTDLSPATLFHCGSNSISFFTRLGDYGLGGPTFAACSTRAGIKSYKAGEAIEASWLEECWILVWFAGAKGWTNWDSPWAVYLQHKPSSVRFDENGLHLQFAGAAGDVLLLPLYGCYVPPQKGGDQLPEHGVPSALGAPASRRQDRAKELAGGDAGAPRGKKIKTWEWAKTLTREPLMRVRYWASVLREFPIYSEDSFSVDREKDTVTIRQRFEWHSIRDDWNTAHLKLAPVSPTLAGVALDKKSPATFSKPVLDHDYLTTRGPYAGVEGVDSYEATFHVLPPGVAAQFVVGREEPGTNTPLCQEIKFQSEKKATIWPKVMSWKDWKTPSGHRWTFGHVQPGTNSVAGSVKIVPLNGNSQAVIYSTE